MEIIVGPGEVSQDEHMTKHEMHEEPDIKKDTSSIPDLPQNGKKKVVHASRRPWITDEFMQKVQQRDALHSRLKKNPTDIVLKKEFTVCRNQTAALRKKLKHAYQMYLEEL